MQLIELPVLWNILLDAAAWLVIHLGIVFAAVRLPDACFERDAGLYRTREWEDGGRFYQRVFHIRRWKDRLPDGGRLLKGGFSKKHLGAHGDEYYRAFVRESRRAEFTHWIHLPFALLFFLWNPVYVGMLMILYAVIANLPCILAQRFNRPRFERVIRSVTRQE